MQFEASDLAREDGKNYGDFQVIFCGKVTKLTDQQKMNSYLALAKQYHVKLVACGISLNKFQVRAKDLPLDITVVENDVRSAKLRWCRFAIFNPF